MKKLLLISAIAASISTGATASITVASYNMPDGAYNGWYNDNLYNGTNAGGYLSGGTGDLTDGVLTASVVYGYGAWSPYVLWDGQSPVITFDLGDVYTLSTITSYFKAYPQAAVYIPESVQLRFSTDGINFGDTQLRTFTFAESNLGNNEDGIYNLLTSAATGRYIELTLNNNESNRWLALSEVTFDGATAVPVPAAAWLFGSGIIGLAGISRRRK